MGEWQEVAVEKKRKGAETKKMKEEKYLSPRREVNPPKVGRKPLHESGEALGGRGDNAGARVVKRERANI
ncbi:hypothetical protein SESBI_03230 [Sesbania bispinosa]|nr:hypothetical protein SESBI_03230 [Sesbania bispinosa]